MSISGVRPGGYVGFFFRQWCRGDVDFLIRFEAGVVRPARNSNFSTFPHPGLGAHRFVFVISPRNTNSGGENPKNPLFLQVFV